jgi:hypothetical protein
MTKSLGFPHSFTSIGCLLDSRHGPNITTMRVSRQQHYENASTRNHTNIILMDVAGCSRFTIWTFVSGSLVALRLSLLRIKDLVWEARGRER